MKEIRSIINILLILCSFSLLQAADEDDFDPFTSSSMNLEEPFFVSLGSICEVAGWMRLCDLRKAAFPFDWILTPNGDRLIELIDNNFERFTDRSYLVKFVFGRDEVKENTNLVHSHYYAEFRHDWHDNYWLDPRVLDQGYKTMIDKYNRRIHRFRQLANYPGRVIFVRVVPPPAPKSPPNYWIPTDRDLEMSSEYGMALNRALRKLFPNLDFTLALINKRGDSDNVIQFDNVLMFNFSKPGIDNYHKLFEYLTGKDLSVHIK